MRTKYRTMHSTSAFLVLVWIVSQPVHALAGTVPSAPASRASASTQADPLPTLQLIRKLRRDDYTFGVTWSADSAALAAFSTWGNLVTIWDASGSLIKELFRPGAVYVGDGLAFIDGHSRIATPPALYKSTNVAVSIFDIKAGKVVQEIPGSYPDRPRNVNAATALAISPDQSTLAVIFGRALPQPVALYSTSDWRRVATVTDPSYASTEYTKQSSQEAVTVSFSPDGQFLAIGLPGDVLIYSFAKTRVARRIHVLDPKDGCCIAGLAFNPDSTEIAVANSSNLWKPLPRRPEVIKKTPVAVFNVLDGTKVTAYPPISMAARDIGWSPDGRFIAFTTEYALHLWNPAHPDDHRSIDLQGSSASLSFSPNGRWLAVCTGYAVDVFGIGE